MNDKELYRYLLGLQAPWSIREIKLDIPAQEIHIWVEHESNLKFPCPICKSPTAVYDHSEERIWRHLDSCHFQTFLHANPPRIECPVHGVKQVILPWAEPHARFTLLFEHFAILVLQHSDVLGACTILGISWDEAWHILDRAVKRGLIAKQQVPIQNIGIDEKAVGKGQDYFTLVNNLDSGTVDYIADGRKKESLDGYYNSRTPEQIQSIQSIAMDMWDAFFASTIEHVPDAQEKIVFDKYHILQHMSDAVDMVRKNENATLEKQGVSTLHKTKYIWLFARENLPEKHRGRFNQLMNLNLKTGRAWAIKETLRGLWDYRSQGWAERFLNRWYFWASHSKLNPVIKVAKMVKSHAHNILTYFKQRITNAVSEGLNSKIETIKRMAYGFRNRDNFKTSIYFHCGGLNLYPATHGIPG